MCARPKGPSFAPRWSRSTSPRYGPEWVEHFLDAGMDGTDPPVYARIEAERMFTFRAVAAD